MKLLIPIAVVVLLGLLIWEIAKAIGEANRAYNILTKEDEDVQAKD
jgi:hypothetical protein